MKKLHFYSWQRFRDFVDNNRHFGSVYWRGQRDPNWPLASRFERILLALPPQVTVDADAYREIRDNYLERFKRAASGLRGSNPSLLSTEQWWALGRHYGLVTPLLDWTEKPYIAAFFALSELREEMLSKSGKSSFKGQKVAIYQLIPGPIAGNGGLRVIRPTVDELGRLQNQRGVFTWLDSEEHFELQSYLDSTGGGDYLTQIILSGDALGEGLIDLDNHGIDYRLLFPDLSGAALAANAVGFTPF